MNLAFWGRVGWSRTQGQTKRQTKGRISARAGALVALAFFVEMTSGCLSNEYRIPQDELMRLAQAPAATRGHHVHVVQSLGSRRAEAVGFHAPLPPPPPVAAPAPPPAYDVEPSIACDGPCAEEDDDDGDDVHARININGDIDLSGGGSGSRGSGRAGAPHGRSSYGPSGGQGLRGSPPQAGLHGTPPQPGLRGSPPAGGWRGTPPAGGGTHVGGGSGGGIGHIGGGGGGGGNGGDAMVILAVVLAVVAVVAGVALVCSEGMRFDGHADIAPEQSIHLKDQRGAVATVALGELTPQDASLTVDATVKDDEDYGLGLGSRGPLDRTGGAFKVELGGGNFNLGLQRVAGMASQIQVGAFFTRSAGVMLDIGLSGGSVCCSTVLTRHSFALEAQVFPWSLGRLHAGAFAKGGVALANDSVNTQSGPVVGGGALVELALTTRLALTFRAAANAARFDGAWSTAGALTGGVAIY